MGLDMYLTKRISIGYPGYDRVGDEFIDRKREPIKVTRWNGDEVIINMDITTGFIQQVGYWRKANAIHMWFVTHVQEGKDDCGEYHVSLENLRELRDTCRKVLDNNDLAEELLPTQEGFFFGSILYDEDYFQDLQDTIDQLDKLSLDDEDKNLWVDYYYQASW